MLLELRWDQLQNALGDAEPGVLDGRLLSRAMNDELRGVCDALKERGVRPRLSVVQVGDDPASSIYIRHKVRACERVGIISIHEKLDAQISQDELHRRLRERNDDPNTHGILLQLPLTEGLDSGEAVMAIDPVKDVDGFHPANLGQLMAGRSPLEPCTPTGVLRLLRAAGVEPRGLEAVVVGRSVIVGRPMAVMLTRSDATVTLCHRHTPDLEALVRRADLLVVATGVPRLIRGDWIKEGAVVVDVGINRVDGRLCGDVEYDIARARASWITPVPGGVGPMTVATLMENTLRAACLQTGWTFRCGELLSFDEAGLVDLGRAPVRFPGVMYAPVAEEA